MRPLRDPASLNAEERFVELARLLAAGLLRLRPSPRCPAADGHPAPEKPPRKLPE